MQTKVVTDNNPTAIVPQSTAIIQQDRTIGATVGSVINYNGGNYAVLNIKDGIASLKSIDDDNLYQPVVNVNIYDIKNSNATLDNNRVIILNYGNQVPDFIDIDTLKLITRNKKGGFVKSNITKSVAEKHLNKLYNYFTSSPDRLATFIDMKKNKYKDSYLNDDVWNLIADKIISEKYIGIIDDSILGSVKSGLASILRDGVNVDSFERDITNFKKLGAKNDKNGITLDKLAENIQSNMKQNITANMEDNYVEPDFFVIKDYLIDVLSSVNTISDLTKLDKNNITFRTTKLNEVYESLKAEFDSYNYSSVADNDFYRNNSMFRVADINRENWNEQEELAWLDNVLPQYNAEQRVKIYDGLIPTGKFIGEGEQRREVKAWGRYGNAMIEISKCAASGTTYHEAFHAVFNDILTDEERELLLGEMRLFHPEMTDIELEEELAEDFRRYIQGKELKHKLTDILEKFMNWLKNIVVNWKKLGVEYDKQHTFAEQYYQRIASGYYKNSPINKDGSVKNEYRYSIASKYGLPKGNGHIFSKDGEYWYNEYIKEYDKLVAKGKHSIVFDYEFEDKANREYVRLKNKYKYFYATKPALYNNKWIINLTRPLLDKKHTTQELNAIFEEIRQQDEYDYEMNKMLDEPKVNVQIKQNKDSEEALREQEKYYFQIEVINGKITYGDMIEDDMTNVYAGDENAVNLIQQAINDGSKVNVVTKHNGEIADDMQITACEHAMVTFEPNVNENNLSLQSDNVSDLELFDNINNCK